MAIISLIDRYIGKAIFYGIMVVLMAVTLLMAFMLFVNNLDELGKADFGLVALARFIILSLPMQLYSLFPAIILIGSVLGLSFLASGSELTAMRASGVSVTRIARAVLQTAFIFIAAGVFLGEAVVPYSEDAAQRGRAQALETGFRNKYSGLWVREGQVFANMGEVLPDRSLLKVSYYIFKEDLSLERMVSAKRAIYEDDAWVLKGVRESRFEGNRMQSVMVDEAPWKTELTPAQMDVFAVKPEGMSLISLHQYIQHLRSNQQRTGPFELTYWNRLMAPLASIVMLLMAIPFVFSRDRAAGMGQRLFIGLGVALVFNFVNLISGYIALLFKLPPSLGAITPVVLFSFLAVTLLRRAA